MLLLEGDATITVALASVIAHVVTIFLVIMFVGGRYCLQDVCKLGLRALPKVE